MNEVKCECGHVNPHGTILCESCGRVMEESVKDHQLVDMRYEGTARRSQTYHRTVVDKIWNFFSSVKVGVWLIVVTLIASSLGTIFPQEMYIPPTVLASDYYEDEYGVFGKIFYLLGFHNLYDSLWYKLLVASIGVSLVICSLDRFVPLYRALKTQRVDRHEGFLQRQRIYGVTKMESEIIDFEAIKKRLIEKKYRVREVNGSLLAEKNRFSRWGPYVNHIGLIIFLIGCLMRSVPGMYVDEALWLREGERKVIPGTDGEFYLENKAFTMEVYEQGQEEEVFADALEERSGMIPKNFATEAVLYRVKEDALPGEEPELEEVKQQIIKVNQPLKFENFAFYQTDYKLNEYSKMSFHLTNKEKGTQLGTITIDLSNPEETYDLGNGYTVNLLKYLPDFKMDENGEPVTASSVPNNPAFVFKMISPEKPDGEISFVAILTTIEAADNNTYKMSFDGVETRNATALTVRKDLTLPVLVLGGIIFMVGVIQGAYWNHRRIWIRNNGHEYLFAAHTNKNWYGLKKEIEKILDGTGLNEPEDRIEKENSSQ
ncbi:MAG: cytochrome c biogenesis protein ResB [Bacillus sp. (in: firmicutes)]